MVSNGRLCPAVSHDIEVSAYPTPHGSGSSARGGLCASARRYSIRLFLSLVVLLFGLASATATTLGDDANDRLEDIPEFADVADYLANHGDRQGAVKIGDHVFEARIIDAFMYSGNTLTDENLVVVYADETAYLAAANRGDTAFAIIGDQRFRVSDLVATESAGNLSVGNFPQPLQFPAGTAIGYNAQATGWAATAVGVFSRAMNTNTLAVGFSAVARGVGSIAIGDYATTGNRNSIALGRLALTHRENSVAIGDHSMVIGGDNLAVGTGSSVARLEPYQSYNDTYPHIYVHDVLECVHSSGYIGRFEYKCGHFISDADRNDTRFRQETSEGSDFRSSIRQRGWDFLDALDVQGSTAIGTWARASDDRATAVGTSAGAFGDRSIAVGADAIAYHANTTAVGRRAYAGGYGSIAIGEGSTALDEDSIAIGRNSLALRDHSTVVGDGAMARGESGTVLGRGALAFGYRSMALGEGSSAARLEPFKSYYDTHPEISPPNAARCVDASGNFANFENSCRDFISDEDRDDARLLQDSPEGLAFREVIAQQASDFLDSLEVKEAIAIGGRARASHDNAIAVGREAGAFGERSIAIGSWASALGTRSIALGNGSVAVDDSTTVVGANSAAFGNAASAFGESARVFGKGSTALGRNAYVARLRTGEAIWDRRFADLSAADLAACAQDRGAQDRGAQEPRDASRVIDAFMDDCFDLLMDNEQSGTVWNADSGEGRTFRAAVRQRAHDLADSLRADYATAVGDSAFAHGSYATAVGQSAGATGQTAIALGWLARAGGDKSTALGSAATAPHANSTAVGGYAQANGEETSAFGVDAFAGGWHVPFRYANTAEYLADTDNATDRQRIVSIGGKLYTNLDVDAIDGLTDASLPESLGTLEGVVAINPSWFISSIETYMRDRLRLLESGDRLAAIGGKVYLFSDLEAVLESDEELTLDNLPDPVKGARGATALGWGAQASGEKSLAVGWGALANGQNAIAIGAGTRAGANQVVIGTSDHSYRFPGLAATQTAKTELITVDGGGNLSADGGALHTRVESLEGRVDSLESAETTSSTDSGPRPLTFGTAEVEPVTTVADGAPGGRSDGSSLDGPALARTVASVELVTPLAGSEGPVAPVDGPEFDVASDGLESRVADLEAKTDAIGTGLGDAGDAADPNGSALARITATNTDLSLASDRLGVVESDVRAVEADLGAGGDIADANGSAHARVSYIQELIDTATTSDPAVLRVVESTRELTDEQVSHVYGTLQERTGVQAVAVNGGMQDAIVIRGPVNEQMSTLIAMLSYRPAAGQQYRDENGVLSAVTAEQFRRFDHVQTQDGSATFGYEGRLAYLFDALYGDPGDGIPYDPAANSQNPHLNSIAGRIGALETGRLPTRLEQAPTNAEGEAPEDIDRRMVVEDYDAATQETRLRTISIGDLAGLDDRIDGLSQRVHGVERRITGLETEVAGVAAVSSALSALPNFVPGGREFYAGVGLGSYSGQAAIAIGASAKVSDGIYVNAGFSKGTSTSLTSRLGIGIAW